MLAQLNLNDYLIDEFAFAANREYEENSTTAGIINIDFDIKRSSESLLDFLITLVVDVNRGDEAFATGEYRIHLQLSGFFSFSSDVEQDQVNGMISHNGLSILYGVARGVVADATASSRHGKFVLPGVNFIELIKQKAAAAKRGEKTGRRPKKK